MDIREITTPALREFYLHLHTEFDLSKKYIQNIMDPLKSIITQAFNESQMVAPKWPDYKAKKSANRPPVWITEEEQDLTLGYVPAKDQPIVRLIFYHALRMIEARKLKRKNLKFARHPKLGEIATIDIDTAKGGPARTILISEPDLLADLKSLIPSIQHPELFINPKNRKPYQKTTLWKIMRKALDKAGLPDVDPNHAGRHSAASQMIARGAPTRAVQKKLGHADIRTTEVYTHVLVEDQAKWNRCSTIAGISEGVGGDK
jgi:integrase/recombinase XerD